MLDCLKTRMNASAPMLSFMAGLLTDGQRSNAGFVNTLAVLGDKLHNQTLLIEQAWNKC
jgi:hypothetical protein